MSDEKIAILNKLKELGIGQWCERGQVLFNPNESNNDENLNELNNQPVGR